MKILVALVLFFPSLNAIAQSESGTLVILTSSQDELVMAADSMSHSSTMEFKDRCKITALGDQLVFAATGNTAYGTSDMRTIYWDGHTIAKKLFTHLAIKRAAEPMPLRLAKAWGEEMKTKFEAEARKDSASLAFGTDDNVLAAAMFAGFLDHFPYIVITQITYRKSPQGHYSFNSEITNTFQRPINIKIGRTLIADELFDGKTPRAVQWKYSVGRLIVKSPSDDPLGLWAGEAIQYSIDHYPLVNIGGKMLPPLGGPVDIVRLRQGKGMDWIRVKDNCPKN
jgi:hypothetical protein